MLTYARLVQRELDKQTLPAELAEELRRRVREETRAPEGTELSVSMGVVTYPDHAGELGKLIESRSRGRLVFQISSLYPVLCRMEDRGWIKGRWVEKKGERRRCFYSLTPDGEDALKAQRKEWRAFSAVVNQVIRENPA